MAKYAFQGNLIKLNQADFDRWQEAYHTLDLTAELTCLDDYYSHEKNVGNWFVRTSAVLCNKHNKNKQMFPEDNDEPVRNIMAEKVAALEAKNRKEWGLSD